MSENGPREGTRDLPRRNPEAGHRAVEENSPAGVAYRKLSRSLQRRRDELADLADGAGPPAAIAEAYESAHPLEPPVSPTEIEAAIERARAHRARGDR